MPGKLGAHRRVVLVVLALGSAALCQPASALAGTYSWSLPGDFTATGANPDHDRYGTTPWSYLDGPSASGLVRLDKFESDVQGGLSGWTDTADTGVFAGVNPQPQSVTGGFQNQDTFATGVMILQPTPQHVVAIRWTSPLSSTVTVSGSIVSQETASPADSGCAAGGWDTWSLDVDGLPLQSQSGTVPASSGGPRQFGAAVSVSPGTTIELLVSAGNAASADPACAPVGATLDLQAPVAAPPVTLDQPAPGAVIDDGQPTFSGSAGDSFGQLGTVTVRVYRGTSVDPSAIVQTLVTSPAADAYSIAPSPFLYDDTYTVQAEQDDLVGDRGLSQPVTFKVADPLPPIAFDPLSGRLVPTAAPLFSGSSGTIEGDSHQVIVLVWPGTRPRGYPARRLTATRGPTGRWSVRVEPPLADGAYVAIAAQDGPAGLIGSQLLHFRIKLHAPAVTVERVLERAAARTPGLLLVGRAGTALGDSDRVTISIYRLQAGSRRAVGRRAVRARHGRWRLHWLGRLAPGRYLISATQRDDAGHLGAASRSFRLGPPRHRRRGRR